MTPAAHAANHLHEKACIIRNIVSAVGFRRVDHSLGKTASQACSLGHGKEFNFRAIIVISVTHAAQRQRLQPATKIRAVLQIVLKVPALNEVGANIFHNRTFKTD